ERVLIRRDTYGIPHIFAETDEAAAFGLGYAQAEDHLDVVARHLVDARGESARIFGPSALENTSRCSGSTTTWRRAASSTRSGDRSALFSTRSPAASISTCSSTGPSSRRGFRRSPAWTCWRTARS